MFRRKMLVMVMLAVFGMIFSSSVEAVTCGKYLGVEQSDGTVKFNGEWREVSEGQTICDIEYETSTYASGSYDALLKCGSDGQFTNIRGDWQTCYCVDNKDGAAYCEEKSNRECQSSNGDNTAATLTHGETGCMGFQDYGSCNGFTGNMEYKGKCPDGQYCQDTYYWFFGEVNYYTCQKATCQRDNVTANKGDIKCVDGDKYKCNDTGGNFSLEEDCKDMGCTDDSVNGATCNVGTECRRIQGTGGDADVEIGTAAVNRSICYNDQVYKCETAPYFEFVKDCAADGTVCYTKEGEADAACAPKEEVDNMTGVISTTTTTSSSSETIMDSSDFLCTVDGGQGTSTALGCVPVEMSKFVPWLLGWLFGVAGGIAFLMMAYGFILIATSGGDEKKVQGARETITAAVVGLIVCIFAVFILKLVAVNILNIPGMS